MEENYTRNEYKMDIEIYTRDIIFATVEIFVGLTILFGNSLILAAVARFYYLQTITNKFVVNLAISDFLVGLMAMINGTYWVYPTLREQKSTCFLVIYLTVVALLASSFSLVVISVDRYIAIMHPLRYPSVMTAGRSTVIISGIWMYSLFSAAIPLFWNRWDERRIEVGCLAPEVVIPEFVTMFVFPVFLILALIMISLYAIIFKQIIRHKRQIQMHLPKGTNTTQKDIKTSITLFLVIGAFLVCWVPIMIALLVAALNHNIYDVDAYYICEIITFVNSCLNPFIYGWKHKGFQRAFRSILKLKRHTEVVDLQINPSRSTD